jgi:hypothetical protein
MRTKRLRSGANNTTPTPKETTMSIQHSPAPWHQEPLQSTQGADIAIIGNGQVIAVIQHDPDIQTADEDDIDGDNVVWSEEDLANARLITLAPQLLEMLEYLSDTADNGDSISNRDWKRVEKLIALAKGEAA